jgi:hypothetical protein
MTEFPRFGRADKKIVGCALDWDEIFEGVDVVSKDVVRALKSALSTPSAHLSLANATGYVFGTLERGKFNTDRAAQIYEMAIERVISETSDAALSVLVLRETGVWKTLGYRLAREFKEDMAAEDQRSARRGWIATFLGK